MTNTDDCFYEDISIIGLGWEIESNSTPVTYSNIGGSNYTKVSDIDINIEVTYYNASASINLTNIYPDLEIGFYNGSDYPYKRYCNLSSIYGTGGKFAYNCTDKIKETSIINAWTNALAWPASSSLKR